MHLESLESTQEARVCASSSPNFPRAFITRYTHAKHEPSDSYICQVSKHRDFLVCQLKLDNFLNHKAKLNLQLKSLDISKQRSTSLRRIAWVFPWNSRINSDCLLCSMLIRACTKTRNNERKRPKRNHQNERNERNETSETSETSETAETKPPKRPKRAKF